MSQVWFTHNKNHVYLSLSPLSLSLSSSLIISIYQSIFLFIIIYLSFIFYTISFCLSLFLSIYTSPLSCLFVRLSVSLLLNIFIYLSIYQTIYLIIGWALRVRVWVVGLQVGRGGEGANFAHESEEEQLSLCPLFFFLHYPLLMCKHSFCTRPSRLQTESIVMFIPVGE